MQSIKNKIDNTIVIKEPFPHIIIDNFLDNDQFEKLMRDVNDVIKFNKITSEQSEKGSILISNKKLKESQLGRDLITFLESEELMQILVKKFEDTRPKLPLKMILKPFNAELIFNPIVKKKKSPRNAHLDPINSYLTWLYYLRDDAEKITSVSFFYYKNGFIGFDYSAEDKMYVPTSNLSKEKIIEALPNRFLGFIGSENSAHAVSERKPNSGIRVYLTGGIRSNKNLYYPFKAMSFSNKLKFLYRRPIQKIWHRILKLKNK